VIAVRRGTRGAPDRQFEELEVPLPSRPRHMPEPVAVGVSCESAGQPRLVDVDRDGDLDVVAIAAADWNGDGRTDLLIGEMLPQKAPADPVAAAELEARRGAAQRVLDVVKQELGRLDATKPPIGDPAAMADRNAWREQLGRWAKGPRELLEAPRQRGTTTPGGRLRALVRS